MNRSDPGTLAAKYLVSEQSYVGSLRQRRHSHRETSITLVVAGTLREQVGRVEEIALPLSIVVKPRDTEHANEFGDGGVNTLQIVVPEAMQSALGAWERNLTHWGWRHAGPATPVFLRLLWRVRESRDPTTDHVQDAVVDALAAIGAAEQPRVHGEAPAWLQRLREELDDDHLRRSVRQLALDAHVHPVYLARQFRRWYGCSITEYNRRRRIQTAAAAIASGDHDLSAVAQRAGFTDHAQMCRLFKRETGTTPSAFSEMARLRDQRSSDDRYAPDMFAPVS